MKTIQKLLLFSLIVLLSNSLWAQKDVKFEIRHWLGSNPFALDMASQNNMGQDFNVTRLEYYLSEISIIHDAGVITRVPDTSFLINPSQPMLVDLGNFAINQVEGIRFHVGVDNAHNHLDLTLFPPAHPLSPKNPSMHWGWTSGYRFIAIEGKSGNNLAFDYQLHGLGDGNFFTTEISAPMLTPFANGVVISLDANYANILQDISIDAGVIEHGESKEARSALVNMRFNVFTPASPTTAIEDDFTSTASLYPNPTTSGITTLAFSNPLTASSEVVVTDLVGRVISTQTLGAGEQKISLNLPEGGVYMVTAIQENKVLFTKKAFAK